MKPTHNCSPSHSGGGESRDIFNAEYTGLPGHHRVLKPPGGGSSDIFGVDPSEPRRVRNTNHLHSSVFGDMMETATPKTGNPVTGEGYAIANGVKEMAASPVAAAPSPVKVNGEAKTNGTVASQPPPQSAQARGRVPPGGYSSGLW